MNNYGIAVNQIYFDNDKRMTGRRIKVLGINSFNGKATCCWCDRYGGNTQGKRTKISLRRLANKLLFTRVE